MGIIHRDIKPSNMMLTQAGSIKVMDFGIARVLGTARMTRQGSVIGTVEYMSPEQVRGQETDARSDIYSLGILLYEMLTGRVPFSHPSEYELMKRQIEELPPPPREIQPGIPPAVESAILTALAKDPAVRFQTAEAMRTALLAGSSAAQPSSEAATRVIHQASNSTEQTRPPSQAGEVIKETRMPEPGQAWAQVYSSGSAIKETRLPSAGAGGQEYWQAQLERSSAAQNPSLFARLNWKHYTAAGVVLMVLLITPLVALMVIKSNISHDRDPVTPGGSPVSGQDKGASSPVVQGAPGQIQQSPAQLQPNPVASRPPIGIDSERPAVGPDTVGRDAIDAEAARKAKARRDEEARREAEARDKARRRAAAEKALDQ